MEARCIFHFSGVMRQGRRLGGPQCSQHRASSLAGPSCFVSHKGIAIALQTTLYGLLFANFLFLPLSKKLSAYVKSEAKLHYIILEGLMDIAKYRNPKAVAYRLQSFLRNYCGIQEYALESPSDKGWRIPFNPFQKVSMRRQHV